MSQDSPNPAPPKKNQTLPQAESELAILQQHNTCLESQIAEYKRRETLHNALLNLQEEIWKMGAAEDIQKVLNVLQTALRDLAIPYHFCCVNVVDTRHTPPRVSAFNIAQTGKPKIIPIKETAARTTVKFWQANRPIYRKNLKAEDPYGERSYLTTISTVLDVPFSHGTLALSNKAPDAFSQSDISTLQKLANSISSVYSRYLDFQKIEDQNRQLTIEQSAERVRKAVGAMKTAEDLEDVVKVMLHELLTRDVGFDLCLINIIDKGAEVLRQYGTTQQGQSGSNETPLSQVPEILLSVYEKQESVEWSVDKAMAERHLKTRQSLGIRDKGELPTSIIEAPFAFGTLSLSTTDPKGFGKEGRALTDEFARVLELGYARFRDFERLETQEGLNQALSGQNEIGEFIGSSEAIYQLDAEINQVAPTDLTVLIQGETGTGKGVAARAIHSRSKRPSGPFIQVNCGAIAEGLIESELFGHEKGAFTGATGRQLGKVELAEGGTLFLDEIGDMPLAAQVKLLQVLQEYTYERVGGTQTLKADTRIVAATNRDLPEMVAAGSFREDLYFRLKTFPIQVPPLRHRRADIPLLTYHFASTFAQHLNRPVPQISPDAMAQLKDYPWPGNVRELEHLIQRAVLVCKGGVVEVQDVALDFKESKGAATQPEILPLAEHEKRYIAAVLDKTQGKIAGKQGAAQLLDIHPETLRSRMRKHGLL